MQACVSSTGMNVHTSLIVGLQPTVIASRAPHLLLEQSVMTIQRIVDVHRPSTSLKVMSTSFLNFKIFIGPVFLRI